MRGPVFLDRDKQGTENHAGNQEPHNQRIRPFEFFSRLKAETEKEASDSPDQSERTQEINLRELLMESLLLDLIWKLHVHLPGD